MTEPPPRFLDTNILLRHFAQDDPDQSPRSTRYLGRLERGEFRVRTADTVIFETVYSLQRTYKQPKARIRDLVLPVIELPGVILPGKRKFRRVFALYVAHNIAFADAYHAVLMERWRMNEVVSFDHEFDRLPDISRVEPDGL